jgi:hypothetical protein
MNTSMVAQDAETFVALGRAVSLAAGEGALAQEEASDLTAALVTGILAGGMELDTYARVHEALAHLLEKAFQAPARSAPSVSGSASTGLAADEPLGVYLEVVGDAWEKVSWEDDAFGRLKDFVRQVFDLTRSRFGDGAWFRAPLRTGFEALLESARAAGLMIVSVEGPSTRSAAEAVLRDPNVSSSHTRIVLGWGDRRAALDLGPPGA